MVGPVAQGRAALQTIQTAAQRESLFIAFDKLEIVKPDFGQAVGTD